MIYLRSVTGGVRDHLPPSGQLAFITNETKRSLSALSS
jgi:hypothetical protein